MHPSDDFVVQILGEMKQHYPRLYRAMVAERDEHMANALVRLAERYRGQHIVVIVGKGHVPGMRAVLEDQGLAPIIFTSLIR